MKSDIKNVGLSFCCNKDWNSMRTVDEQKRFCESCQHNVIDFTKASNTELTAALQSSARVCGRFKRSQMSDTFLKYAASLALASSVTLSCSPMEEKIQPDIPILIEEEADFLGDIELTGIILDIPADSVDDESIKIEVDPPDSSTFNFKP